MNLGNVYDEIESNSNSSSRHIMNEQRNAKFFEITGRTLVHPISYRMQEFQKQIISTAISKNTLISLPSGLGMPYLASVIVFNFQRWFLNGKVVVLSQNKSLIVEQLNAYNSYTTLSEEHYADLYANTTNENGRAWKKPIVLTTPIKFLESIQNNTCKVNNLVLLIIYETNKIVKCQEYENIMNTLNGIDFRVVVFVDGCGFNSRIVKQIIDVFNISQLEIRKLSSPDIKACTYCSEIESVALNISAHMISIKDAFYAVYEKYGKLLKDAKVINGNVASFTKNQIQKAKEKFLKAPPQNMAKEVKQKLLDSMIMCAFLCTGIDILHNWGVRSFYNYLFDENKDGELKALIVQDEHLKNQMKLLNEYLKSNGKKIESLMARIIHPKLLYLKNLITRYFSETEGVIEDTRIIVFCSMDEIVDDIDRLLCSLPDYIRHQCVKTKSKSLANTNEYKEVIKNFNDGVINVLVVNNLVEEIIDVRTNLFVCLEPNKSVLKFSDPRFHQGADKCFFVLTKGTEYNKFEVLLNDKRSEQKSVDIPDADQILKESPNMFPKDFNPEFESTSVAATMSSAIQSPGQKTMLNYLQSDKSKKSKKNISITNANDITDRSIFTSSICDQSSPSREPVRSPSLFSSYVEKSLANVENDPPCVISQSFDISPQHIPCTDQCENMEAKNNLDDSFDELILDFAVTHGPKKPTKTSNLEAYKPLSNQSSDKENDVFSVDIIEDTFKYKNDLNSVNVIDDTFKHKNDLNSNNSKIDHNQTNSFNLSKLSSLRDCAKNLEKINLTRNDCSSPSMLNSPPAKSECRSPSILEINDTNIFNEINSTTMQREMMNDFSLFDYSRECKNTRSSINLVPQTPLNQTRNISPILSLRKTDKKLSSSLYPIKDRSESIHFDSSFEVGDDFSIVNKLHEQNKTTNENPPEPNEQKINDWDPDCELFEDDDTFDEIAATLITPQKESITVKTSTPVIHAAKICDIKTSTPVVNSIKQNNSGASHYREKELFQKNVKETQTKSDDCDINFSISYKKKPISNSFFSNFSSCLKQRSQNSQPAKNAEIKKLPVESRTEDDNDSVEEFPWMKTKPKSPVKVKLKFNSDKKDREDYPWLKKSSPGDPNSPSVSHITPSFKKPGPFSIISSKSRSVTPSTPISSTGPGSDPKSIFSESTPEVKLKKNFKRKKSQLSLKRNLAEQFLDNEAEVTSDDDDNAEECSQLSDDDDSFVVDDTVTKPSNYSHYLKSMKSPRTGFGKFHIPVLSESKLKMNVCSQMDYFDQTYQNDSFCVDDVEVGQDSEYVPSILTQMEDRIRFEEKAKKKSKFLPPPSDNFSDNESDSSNLRKKKYRKRIVCFSSSDSDD